MDFRLPWAHLERPPFVRKALSLLACAVTFPGRAQWDLIIGDGPQHLPIVMKTLGLLRPDQKTLPYLAGEFPYFLATGRYGERKTRVLTAWFQRWDAYLCVGPMIADLVRQTLPAGRHEDVWSFPNFVREGRAREMAAVRAPLEGSRLTFIGSGPGGFRVFYKGLDLLLESVARARATRPSIECAVVGDWEEVTRARLVEQTGSGASIRWMGPTGDLVPILRETALYVHCGRGDAWPNTVMEAMAAGVPPLVSEWTGGRELVALIDPRLVAPLDPTAFAERIDWYLSLEAPHRRELGARAREITQKHLTQAGSQAAFRDTIRQLLNRYGLSHLTLPGEVA